ncbi:hypothetical protein EDM55_11640 [Brevibacillus centrosporus]|nr:hypothetical protein EDM55_11640 [Brevibacillus centrosporus]
MCFRHEIKSVLVWVLLEATSCATEFLTFYRRKDHVLRVLTITLLATTNFAPDLPPMEEKVIQYFTQAAEIDWTKEEVVIAFTVGKWKVLAGSKHPFEEKRINELAVEEVKRSQNIASMNNHGLVTGGESYLVRTGEIDVPTLVIHGTEDPIIPYAHGVALAQRLVRLNCLLWKEQAMSFTKKTGFVS